MSFVQYYGTAPARTHNVYHQGIEFETNAVEHEDFERMIRTLEFQANMPWDEIQVIKQRRLEEIVQDISYIMDLCPLESTLRPMLASLKWSVGTLAGFLYTPNERMHEQHQSTSNSKSNHQEQQHARDGEILGVQEELTTTGSEHEMESLDVIVGGDEVEHQSSPLSRENQSAGLGHKLESPQMVSSASNGAEQDVFAASVGPQNTQGIFEGQQKAARHRCRVCQKSFTRATTLREHVRSHDNDRQYDCASCSKYFVRLKDMKRHEATHSGSKPYACIGQSFGADWGCGRKFAREDGLLAHFRTKTGWECIQALGQGIIADSIGNQIQSKVGPAGAYQCGTVINDVLQVKENVEHSRSRASHTSECGSSFPTLQSFKSHLESDEGMKCLKSLVVQHAIHNTRRTASSSPQREGRDSDVESRERSPILTDNTAEQEELKTPHEGSVSNVGRGDESETFGWGDIFRGCYVQINAQVLTLLFWAPYEYWDANNKLKLRYWDTKNKVKLRLRMLGNEYIWTCGAPQTEENKLEFRLPSLHEIESSTSMRLPLQLRIMTPDSQEWRMLGWVIYEDNKAVEFRDPSGNCR